MYITIIILYKYILAFNSSPIRLVITDLINYLIKPKIDDAPEFKW